MIFLKRWNEIYNRNFQFLFSVSNSEVSVYNGFVGFAGGVIVSHFLFWIMNNCYSETLKYVDI